MDTLIILLIIVGVIGSFSKKYKEQFKATEKQGTAPHTPFSYHNRAESPKAVFHSSPLAAARPVSQEGYSPLSPRVEQTAQEWTGSLQGNSTQGTVSTEGMDICDASLGHQRLPLWLADETEPLFGAEENATISSDALLQGVIMSEILTRPSQRKWGRR